MSAGGGIYHEGKAVCRHVGGNGGNGGALENKEHWKEQWQERVEAIGEKYLKLSGSVDGLAPGREQ